MLEVSINEIGAKLPQLLQCIRTGETVLVTDEGKAVAELRPVGENNGKNPHVRKASEPEVDRSREMRWLAAHSSEYAGQWVALDGERLLCHSANAREVFASARQSGVERPLIIQVPARDALPFAGW
ncbi:MAG: DUF5678 domain-containing protein [Blastocatellia bacterium]